MTLMYESYCNRQSSMSYFRYSKENGLMITCKHPLPVLFGELRKQIQAIEHMFSIHGFNIGLLDNLVEVDEYLDKLRSMLNNLVCIYCEKTFKSHSVLRKHMRKKKHFKIHPHNHKYDKYYVINFTEPGKSWQMLEDEQPDLVDDEEVSSSGSTDDDFLHYLKSVCLFDDCTLKHHRSLFIIWLPLTTVTSPTCSKLLVLR